MNRFPLRPASLLSRLLGYTRRRPKVTRSAEADRWENEGGRVAGLPVPAAVSPHPARAVLPPRNVSRRGFTLLLFGATAFIVALSLLSGESASLTLLPATFVILFVLTVASLRRP